MEILCAVQSDKDWECHLWFGQYPIFLYLQEVEVSSGEILESGNSVEAVEEEARSKVSQ